MEMANITYQDESDSIKVRIDHDKCITCGFCVSACKHDARYFVDDTEQFLYDLTLGVPISLIVAPSIRTNIPEFKKLFTLLKSMGVREIFDVSLGADICIWAHVKYIKENGAFPTITQPCPTIVRYCEIYQHELLPKLSPIHSPMACTSIFLREHQGLEDRIAALSPCMAKEIEFQDTGVANYNVTFTKLLQFLSDNNIDLPEEETDFDLAEGGLGSMFPMPGGFKENVEFFVGKNLHIAKSEGSGVYENLIVYKNTPDEFLPDLYDVLNCEHGCNIGTATSHDKSLFEIEKTMKNTERRIMESQKKKHYKAVYKEYERMFSLEMFMRTYKAIPLNYPSITNVDIENAFSSLGKYNYEMQHIDCFACGSGTCLDMARKIALNVSIPNNCIVKVMEDARIEHDENMLVQAQMLEMERTHEADEHKRVMLDATPIAAHYWNEKLEIYDCNQALLDLFGLSQKSDFINNLEKFTPKYQPDGRPSDAVIKNVISKTFDTGYQKIELINLHSNGEEIPIEDTYVLIEYKGSKIVVGYSVDLREHKKLLKEVENKSVEAEKQRRIAEDANKAKSDFLSHISHEIRTPINAVLGTAEIQLQKDSHKPEIEEAFSTVYNSGNMLLNIINDLLDFSKIEAGKLDLSEALYDIPSIIYDTVQLNMLRYESKPLDFILNIDEDTPLDMVGDELRIKQILNNVLSNAYKYSDVGTIELSVNAEYDIDDTPDAVDDDIRRDCILVLSVRDTGQGMSKEQIDVLFDEYTRFNLDANRTIVGTGLGMHITKRLADAMDGEIIVQSEVGKGTEFTVRIPQQRVGTKVCGPELSDKLRSGKFKNMHKKRTQIAHEYMPYGSVLIVDDVDSNLYVAKGMMIPYGLRIETASSGIEAVEKVECGSKYDIIFMDHMMPKMNGMEATKIIRDMGYTKPIVALTANAVAGAQAMFLANGFDAFISKPIDIRELNSVLNRQIRDKYPQDIVEAARRQAGNKKVAAPAQVSKYNISTDLMQTIVKDAEGALKVLEEQMPIIAEGRFKDLDLNLYTTTVHGMKSVMMHLGEPELSAIARRLEQAGNDENLTEITADTPTLIDAIRLIVKKNKTDTNDSAEELPAGDTASLREKLEEILTACQNIKKRDAQAYLNELRSSSWNDETTSLLNDISKHILHGEYKKAVSIIEKALEG